MMHDRPVLLFLFIACVSAPASTQTRGRGYSGVPAAHPALPGLRQPGQPVVPRPGQPYIPGQPVVPRPGQPYIPGQPVVPRPGQPLIPGRPFVPHVGLPSDSEWDAGDYAETAIDAGDVFLDLRVRTGGRALYHSKRGGGGLAGGADDAGYASKGARGATTAADDLARTATYTTADDLARTASRGAARHADDIGRRLVRLLAPLGGVGLWAATRKRRSK
jgi:hypothetical protein